MWSHKTGKNVSRDYFESCLPELVQDRSIEMAFEHGEKYPHALVLPEIGRLNIDPAYSQALLGL